MNEERSYSIIIYLANHLEPVIISDLKYPIYSSDMDYYYILDGDRDRKTGEFRKDNVIGIFIEEDHYECSSKS